MSIELQQIDIVHYYNERSLFNLLGGHLAGCKKEELTLMNQREGYPAHVRSGMKAITAENVSHDILKLVGAIKRYDTLWAGLRDGFADGIKDRLDTKKDSADLVRLAMGLRSHPDLQDILREALAEKNHSLEIRAIDMGHDAVQFVACHTPPGQLPELFVKSGSCILPISSLSPQERHLRHLAENTFPQQAPA